MTILITGANGQVGRELVVRSGSRTVLALDRATLDITNPSAIAVAIKSSGASLVINAAAYTAVDKAETDVTNAFAVNRDGPAALARACAEAGIPLFHLSTDYVFDGSQLEPYTEDAPTSPIGVYGRSKWEGEQAVRLLLPQHLILRVAWVFGALGDNFIKTMLRLAATQPELRVVADQRGSPTHAGAIADVLLGLADRVHANENIAWGTYHYVGEPVVSWYEFACSIFEEAHAFGMIVDKPVVHPISTAEYPTLARRPANAALDCKLAAKRLGIVRRPWVEGLRETLSDWKSPA